MAIVIIKKKAAAPAEPIPEIVESDRMKAVAKSRCTRCGYETPMPCDDRWKERDCARGMAWNRHRWWTKEELEAMKETA